MGFTGQQEAAGRARLGHVLGDGAEPLSGNGFKVPLLKRTIVRALLELTEGSSR